MITILLHGPFGAGKDSVANALVEGRDCQKVALADKVREGALAINPWIRLHPPDLVDGLPFIRLRNLITARGWEVAKREYPDVRLFLQRYATEACRDIHGKDCWTKAAEPAMRRALESSAGLVISDFRFPSELDAVLRWKEPVFIWSVERPGHEFDPAHVSEHYRPQEPAIIIRNEGDLDDLLEQSWRAYDLCVRRALRKLTAVRP